MVSSFEMLVLARASVTDCCTVKKAWLGYLHVGPRE